MTWGAPLMLFLLPVTAAVILLAAVLRHYRRKRLDRFLSAPARQRMRAAPGPALTAPRLLLATLGLLLVTLSLARPQWGYSWRDIQRRGLEVMVVLDTSNSMRANDLTPSRLQRAKWGLEELTRTLDGDRIGLTAFAGDAAVLCPLTLDYGAFMLHLDDVFPGIIPRGGTNIEAALRTAMNAFDDPPPDDGADRVILLVSDGETHEGDLDAIINELRTHDIRVFAIGIGDPDGALIPLPEEEGGGHLRNRQGEVVMSALDEATLLRLTRRTNGLYVRATQTEFGVEHLIEEGFAPLKRAQLEETRIREMEERYQLFLGAGILLLLLEGFIHLPFLFKRRAAS